MKTNRSIRKTPVYRLAGATAALGLLFACLSTFAKASEDTQLIAVSGMGSLTLVPDTASITLGISVRGSELPKMQAAADAVIASALETLQGLNMDDRDLAATNIRISPRYRYDQSLQKSIADGYEVSRDLRVTVRDLTLLGQVMSEASSAGINSVSPPQLSSSKYEDNYQQALLLAVQQAKQRAAALAKAADVQLGPVVRMSTHETSYRPEQPMRMVMESDAPGATYQPGEIQVSAKVNVAFAIQPE